MTATELRPSVGERSVSVLGWAMLISEIFYSVQGEGSLVGVPSVFVRTSGCNLRCAWCDTPYASWHPEGVEMSEDEIIAAVTEHPTRFVVITGGEPMIAKGIRALAERLREAGKHITIETAATVMPDDVACDLASLSPKLENSTPDGALAGAAWRERHEATRRRPDVVAAWCEAYDFQLKFVVSSAAELSQIERLLDAAGVRPSPEKVLLMPEGRTLEELHRLNPQVVDWCKERGWRYCSRLHIDLFGNKRGT